MAIYFFSIRKTNHSIESIFYAYNVISVFGDPKMQIRLLLKTSFGEEIVKRDWSHFQNNFFGESVSVRRTHLVRW